MELLEKQQKVNADRIKKLEEHKQEVEPQIKNLNSEEEHRVLLETMKRLEKNLRAEYELQKDILKAIESKDVF